MEGQIDYLQNLTVERRSWRIQVRVVRLWKQPSYNKGARSGDCLEMVVVDQQVTNTLAVYPILKFLHLRHSHGVNIIRGFIVLSNTKKQFKACDSKLRICFQYKTIITECDPVPVPTSGLKFADFASVPRASKNNEFLIGMFTIKFSSYIGCFT